MTMPGTAEERLTARDYRRLSRSGTRLAVRRLWCHAALMIADLAALLLVEFAVRWHVVGATLFLYTLKDGQTVTHSTGVDHFVILGLLCMLYFRYTGHYTQRRPVWDELRPLSTALFLAMVADLAVLWAAGAGSVTAGAMLSWAVLLLALPLARGAARWALARARIWHIPTVIVGAGENARQTAMALAEEKGLGFDVELALDPLKDAPRTESIEAAGKVIPVVPLDDDQMARLTSGGGPHVMLALEEEDVSVARDLLARLAVRPNAIDVVPPVRGIPLYGLEVNHLFGRELLLLRVRNNLARRGPRLLKRILDLVGSTALLVVLAPLFVVIALLVRREGGSAFFAHNRVGLHGETFKCLKFRTMVPNAEKVLADLLERDPAARAEWEKDFKLKNDPRVTPIGRFLRRTSLDELPQLINVLRGEMSLVGPRPVPYEELQRYGRDASYYLQVRPGITGLWQISGRNDVKYENRVFLDSWYVKNWSLWYDVVILLRTTVAVLSRQGAY